MPTSRQIMPNYEILRRYRAIRIFQFVMKHEASIIQTAIKHLRGNDPVLDRLIGEVGAFDLRLERNAFRMLVRSIISQQISTAAARSIRARLEALLAPAKVTADGISALSVAQLRSVG